VINYKWTRNKETKYEGRATKFVTNDNVLNAILFISKD